MTRHHSRALRYLGIAIALVALCAITPAFADEQPDAPTWTVGVHAWSVHEPKAAHASNDNPGIYVRHAGWQAGVYRNSIRRPSAYVVRTWDIGPVEVAAGLVTGYQRRWETAPCAGEPQRLHRATTPAVTSEPVCAFSRGSTPYRVAPIASLSTTLPAVLGVTPRLTWVPRAGGSAHVIHLSIERSL